MKQSSLYFFVFLISLAFLGAGCDAPSAPQTQKSIEAPRETLIEEKQEAVEESKEVSVDEGVLAEEMDAPEDIPKEIPKAEPLIMLVETPKLIPKPSTTPASDLTPTPESIVTPKPTPIPPPTEATCSCPSVDMDCPEFSSPEAAQAVYNCCMDLKGFDVHRLDRDKDGLACEAS